MESKWENRTFKNSLEERVYSSRLMGSDENLVLHGGGNTSVKVKEIDHTGREVEVLRVKGSGSDLATITEGGFTGLRMEDLLAARKIESMSDEKMVDYLKKSMINPSEPSPSVESFLHAFIGFKFVDHSHSDAILSITNTTLDEHEIEDIFGKVLVIPYIPPGFKLAKEMLKHLEKLSENIDGVILLNHGLFTFGETAKESYERHVKIVNRAEEYVASRIKDDLFKVKYDKIEDDSVLPFIPKIRGLISANRKKILKIDTSEFASVVSRSEEAEKFQHYGPATPDMLIRTKYDYLYIDDIGNSEALIKNYAKKYEEEYTQYVRGYPMHDPYPTIIVVRGYGIITSGPTGKEANIIHDQIIHSFRINANASKISKHKFITKKEAYEMEYWPLQEAKLKKSLPKKLQGTVSVVTGAAGGIGLEAFRTLALNGSHVIALDIDNAVIDVGESLLKESGFENLPIQTDLSDEDQVKKAIERSVREFGGVDIVFNNAGILKTAPLDKISTVDMDTMYRVNSRGTFLVTRETFKVMKSQGIGGNFVFNITKNLTNPGAEMAMYGSTKAFAAQLSHYVAKEGGKYKIRSNIINPDKIFRGSKIWEGGVLESRAKAKGQTIEEYKTQNLLGVEVLPEHVVGVLMALIDDSTFGATTDAMIPVDGGIK